MLKEFKDFAMRGGLIDIAVGLVMAAAFGAIVVAFVEGMFMPVVGQLFQVGDLAKAEIILSPEVKDASGVVVAPKSAVMYGRFISAIINFVIVAFVMFLIVKGVNKMGKKQVEIPAPPSNEEVLLGQIRDLLKK